GIHGQRGECVPQLDGSLSALVGDDEVDRQGKKIVGLALQISNASLDRQIDDRIVVDLVGDRLVVAFEEGLIDAVVFVEKLERRFQALSEAINRSSVEAFVVYASDLKDDAALAAFGQKDV